jgi:hypothetical protein
MPGCDKLQAHLKGAHHASVPSFGAEILSPVEQQATRTKPGPVYKEHMFRSQQLLKLLALITSSLMLVINKLV